MKCYLMFLITAVLGVFLTQGCSNPMVEPSYIDLTGPEPDVLTGHLGMGTAQSPDGVTLDADSRCFYRNGNPWIPVMGEFHYSRCPRDKWRDELLKMKAGGIDIVAAYVFWIHHEEEQGQFDWTGRRNLRDFLFLCQELDLLAIVRMGPWCHGEVRYGGFPDWVQHADFWAEQKRFKKRTDRPEFMQLVEPLYREIAAQAEGLLWKDGGPVVGVQHDNECSNVRYLLALKKLARDHGMDVPIYTMTGWNRVAIPNEGLLPLFGAYADGFWASKKSKFRKSYFFTPIRDDGDMGALDGRIGNVRPQRNEQIERFPYVCCEIGGGMISSYDNRIHVSAEDTAAMALVRLGNGNNMPGYYMYHGGINPEGKLTTLNETKATGYPNDMPVKDYDFGAPLGAAGQVRESYHLLRQQHLFLKDFGSQLAPMRGIFPEVQPTNFDDVTTVRWSVRSDGQSGFIFFNNHQRYLPLPAKENVQFAVNTKEGVLQIPKRPITLPAGAFGILPFNIDFGGIGVTYATAQPICSLQAEGQQWFFFTAIEGIDPEFVLAKGNKRIKKIKPGTDIAFSRRNAEGNEVHFVVLTPEQGRQLWKMSIAGRDRVILSENVILPENDGTFRIETLGHSAVDIALFPACGIEGDRGKADGIFGRFSISEQAEKPQPVACQLQKETVVSEGQPISAMDEDAWKNAAVWKLEIPRDKIGQDCLLRIHYTGDVARLYAGGKLIVDNFYNGRPFDIAVQSFTPEQFDSLEVRIMPLRSDSRAHMTDDVRPDFSQKAAYAEIFNAELLQRMQWPIKCVSQ